MRLLTELQKQDAVLAELPEDYEILLFNGRVVSQFDEDFRSL
ncbi:MAG TPA: hypothetical protein VKI65_07575 [Gemmataceae bacterium]|nr:hypothetical protein [Gemmataceae bacterium]